MKNHFLGKNRIGLLILNQETNKILVTKNQEEIIFEIPGGRMDVDENIESCIKREIKEELNIDLQNISPEYIFSIQEVHVKENTLQLSIFLKINLPKEKISEIKFSNEAAGIVWVEKSDFRNFNYFESTLKALEKYFEVN